MIFNIVTFSLFWLVYRYNTLYVTKFRFDTGGLLYPKAINQLFTGLYVMELCLIGLFFLVRDADSEGRAVGTPCKGQAIVMVAVLFCTIIYQILLNKAFSPLFKYLPITLEDDAVIRDSEFAKAQQKRWDQSDDRRSDDSIDAEREKRARGSAERNKHVEEFEMQKLQAGKDNDGDGMKDEKKEANEAGLWHTLRHLGRKNFKDTEAQGSGPDATADALFAGLNDEIEDLTPDERDHLVRHAFQHEALRAKRPVIWIPRDEMGVSDDEIHRTQKLSNHIWISNEHTGLDQKCRVVYRKCPPDFSEIDLIEL